jgi:hypothetical protein
MRSLADHPADCDCTPCTRHRTAEIRREEIAWLRSFGWNDEQIARRLGLDIEVMRRDLYRQQAKKIYNAS